MIKYFSKLIIILYAVFFLLISTFFTFTPNIFLVKFFNNKYITKEEQENWYEKYKNNINDKMFMIYYDEIPVGTIALYNIDFENNIAEFGRLLIGNTIFRGTNCQAKCNT